MANIGLFGKPPVIYTAYLWGMKKLWDQILRYLFIKKKDPNAPKTTYVKMMHGMNRISILLFLICVIILLVRLFSYVFRHLAH